MHHDRPPKPICAHRIVLDHITAVLFCLEVLQVRPEPPVVAAATAVAASAAGLLLLSPPSVPEGPPNCCGDAIFSPSVLLLFPAFSLKSCCCCCCFCSCCPVCRPPDLSQFCTSKKKKTWCTWKLPPGNRASVETHGTGTCGQTLWIIHPKGPHSTTGGEARTKLDYV